MISSRNPEVCCFSYLLFEVFIIMIISNVLVLDAMDIFYLCYYFSVWHVDSYLHTGVYVDSRSDEMFKKRLQGLNELLKRQDTTYTEETKALRVSEVFI